MIEQGQFWVSPRTELCEAKGGRDTLNDAWDAANWDGLCGTPWQMVALELKLTAKVAVDNEGAGPPLPRIVVERIPEVEPRIFYVLSADIEAHRHTEMVRVVQRLHHTVEQQNHITTNEREP